MSAQTVRFEAPSLDGTTAITGEVDVADTTPPLIIITVAGTGAFDRDVHLGKSGGPRDLVFKDLSNRLNAVGLWTARYDKRGVRCGSGRLAGCIDERVIGTTTDLTGAQDVVAVANWLRRWRPDACIAIFAHSEGMFQVAHAVESLNFQPVAIFGVGAPMESPKALYRWQRIERIPDSLKSADHDHDGLVTNKEIDDYLSKTPAGVFGDMSIFHAPNGAYTPEDIERVRAAWTDYYERERTDALQADPKSEFRLAGQTVASYAWWRQWFVDEEPIAHRLRNYRRPIRLFYGSLDSQTPPTREIPVAVGVLGENDLKTTVIPDVGHTLGEDVFLGPMQSAAAQVLVDEIKAVMDKACP